MNPGWPCATALLGALVGDFSQLAQTPVTDFPARSYAGVGRIFGKKGRGHNSTEANNTATRQIGMLQRLIQIRLMRAPD
jgi:hypothetical protein